MITKSTTASVNDRSCRRMVPRDPRTKVHQIWGINVEWLDPNVAKFRVSDSDIRFQKFLIPQEGKTGPKFTKSLKTCYGPMPDITPNFIALGQTMHKNSVTKIFYPLLNSAPQGDPLGQSSPILEMMNSKTWSTKVPSFVPCWQPVNDNVCCQTSLRAWWTDSKWLVCAYIILNMLTAQTVILTRPSATHVTRFTDTLFPLTFQYL